MLGGLLIAVLCFLLLFPVLLMFTSLWASTRPVIDNQITNSTMNASLQAQALAHINGLGDGFFYNSSDSIVVIMYLVLIAAFFISALYESASATSLPIGLLFLIPLILITFPLSDISHAFYTNAGFANVAHYYVYTEYLSDYSPMITILVTIIYLVLIVTRRGIGGIGGGDGVNVSGSAVVSG